MRVRIQIWALTLFYTSFQILISALFLLFAIEIKPVQRAAITNNPSTVEFISTDERSMATLLNKEPNAMPKWTDELFRLI